MMSNTAKTKKLNIPFCLACILFCITLISIHFTSGLYAKYTAKTNVNDVARVAVMASDVSLELADVPIAPGESNVVELTIANYENENICEVAQRYSLSIRNIEENIPFTWTIYTDAQKQNIVENVEGTFNAGKKESATYWIEVNWPEEHNNAVYAFEIDAIEMIIDAEQID